MSLYVFEVHYYSDLLKFLQLIREKQADFISAAPYYRHGTVHGWAITYQGREELGMEVLT